MSHTHIPYIRYCLSILLSETTFFGHQVSRGFEKERERAARDHRAEGPTDQEEGRRAGEQEEVSRKVRGQK